jgi:hypothetical protein
MPKVMVGAAEKTRSLGFTIGELAARWELSPFTIRRLVDSDHLRTITIGARRFIPLDEVLRAEQEGTGVPRKRKTAEQVGA